MSTPAFRNAPSLAPEKGVFPLDHFHECEREKKSYLDCLRANASDADKCTTLSKAYLECRMSKELMAKEDLKNLGFRERSGERDGARDATVEARSDGGTAHDARATAHVAGLRGAGARRGG